MTSPAYVFHATGAMKALLDHFAYRWIPHRPAPEMFGKRAVIITQCLGSGAKSAAKDMKHSLSWWGISKIEIFTGALMSDIVWEKLPQKKQAELAGKLQKLSRKFAHIDYTKPAHTNLITKFIGRSKAGLPTADRGNSLYCMEKYFCNRRLTHFKPPFGGMQPLKRVSYT